MIYYVEDDSNIRDLVVYTLESTGLPAKGFPESRAFWDGVARECPTLILLDIMLPGDDGVTILRALRERPDTADIPVIMATARGAEYDKVRALDLGADDYITKPYAMMELISRVKAVLRRSGKRAEAAGGRGTERTTERLSAERAAESSPERTSERVSGRTLSPDEFLSVGAITMDSLRHIVTAGGEEIPLTLKEYEFLRKLMLNPEIVLSRDQILADVWGYEFDGETRTVDVHVRTLRQKLGAAGSQIETIRGVGYRIRSRE